MRKAVAVAFSAAALSLTAVPAAHAAPANAVTAAVTCPGSLSNYTHVQSSVDWLKVRTGPSTSYAAVGQLPGGAAFTFSSSGVQSGGHYWVCGYGYNGSTKLTGWVAGEYLVWP
ncbi:SH3 domain-containing protein [Streptacidiphilus sp. ASG 303]|uniref:SH3 domain-containing protein n=1 Tax=Streptacidiphilus sp. ASG 303 TaxID=2896847 RepID=UPI001E4E46F1|nr:SH3 domain-containing protein [Streptacidiphilus sp. ASG 303]MCD0484889.1 SH3 domain-containing protein [Streptacidiphilus sp. ASG 303]